MDEEQRKAEGTTARRRVLGNEWVDRSLAGRNAFNERFLDFMTRYAWGEIWTGQHFDDRTRRILVIGTMIALGKWEEFRTHVAAAVREGGFTPEDIAQIVLQQTVYCGVPTGNNAMKEAGEVLRSLGLAP
jgi:4-carboxymuconolactone decarboxylase